MPLSFILAHRRALSPFPLGTFAFTLAFRETGTVHAGPLEYASPQKSFFVGITVVKNNAELLLVLSNKEGSWWESQEANRAAESQ